MMQYDSFYHIKRLLTLCQSDLSLFSNYISMGTKTKRTKESEEKRVVKS